MKIYKIKDKVSFYIVGLLWLLSSCADNENTMLSDDAGAVDVPVAVQMGVVDSGEEDGEPEERMIYNARVFIFNAVTGVCEKIHEYDFNTSSNNTFIIKAGKKHILSVANYDSDIASLTADAIDYTTLLNKETSSYQFQGYGSMVMSDRQESVEISPDRSSTNPHAITIELKRLAAKLSFSVNIAEELKSKITASSITAKLVNVGNKTCYFFPGAILPEVGSTEGIRQVANTVGADATFERKYLFENESGANQNTASYIQLNVPVSGNNRTANIYIGDTKVEGDSKRYNIYRNYWYKVQAKIVSIEAGELQVETSVLKWNLADKVEVMEGFGFNTSSMPEIDIDNDAGTWYSSISYTGGTPPFKVTWYLDRVKVVEDINFNKYTHSFSRPLEDINLNSTVYCKIEDADGRRLVSDGARILSQQQ